MIDSDNIGEEMDFVTAMMFDVLYVFLTLFAYYSEWMYVISGEYSSVFSSLFEHFSASI